MKDCFYFFGGDLISCISNSVFFGSWGLPWWINSVSQLSMNWWDQDPKAVDKFLGDSLQVKWSIPTEQDLQFTKRMVALGLDHMSLLLRYCIPEPNEAAMSVDNSSTNLQCISRRPSLCLAQLEEKQRQRALKRPGECFFLHVCLICFAMVNQFVLSEEKISRF